MVEPAFKAGGVSPRRQQLASSEWPFSFEASTPFGNQARSERVNSFASFVAGADESDCEADYDADGYASDEDDADSYWDRCTRRAYSGADDYAHRRERERANAADVGALDFKNVALLHSLLTERGGIPPRSATGFTRRKQKKLAREIKRCRHLGLLAGRDLVLELGADDA
ncbi:putative 30S ribosomal subunit protein S18 [Candidatus Hodgkinia cicadicola Dsem]|nr:putative 30S ribosomal subunit protein S18 [Candidatus Hodgkinia cicadicola Dsem]